MSQQLGHMVLRLHGEGVPARQDDVCGVANTPYEQPLPPMREASTTRSRRSTSTCPTGKTNQGRGEGSLNWRKKERTVLYRGTARPRQTGLCTESRMDPMDTSVPDGERHAHRGVPMRRGPVAGLERPHAHTHTHTHTHHVPVRREGGGGRVGGVGEEWDISGGSFSFDLKRSY